MIWGYDVHEFAISGFKNKLVVENRELPLLHFKESSSIQYIFLFTFRTYLAICIFRRKFNEGCYYSKQQPV